MHRDAESLPARGFLSGGRRYKTDPVIAVCAIYQSIIRRREGICQGPRGTLIGNLQAPPCSIPSCIAKTATNLRLVAAPFVVPLTGIEPVRCCHRGILSPLRLPVSPRRHAPSHRTTAANTCQAQETRTAAARTSPDLFDKSARQPPIPDTRLLHRARKFDKIINYFYRYRFWIRGTLHL